MRVQFSRDTVQPKAKKQHSFNEIRRHEATSRWQIHRQF